ncbi:hypothetical protein RVR_6127 [Actinacidiphila reveromycinica]|uniref:Uncharacterized protein n=1 Tax=Actinacidiphila reveromycinica TaxID=659352 RepID=A0A7U3UVP6_9ACTN|nr:hypothetical protein [Streptomyces sp. SN-593]BBA99486.1 hypothetical protein RVR_6127 [Streptomyces sp. SN-593]
MRLLPWQGADGKPCYLDTDADGSSFLSRLADNVEAVQLGLGRDLLARIRRYEAEQLLSEDDLRVVVTHLCTALADVLRVAESRGARVPDADEDEGGGNADDAVRLRQAVQSITGRAFVRRDLS